MQEQTHIPRFVSTVAIVLGCVDLIRGFMHIIPSDDHALRSGPRPGVRLLVGRGGF